MTFQTIDQVLPLLELIAQPAFCLRNDGSILCNRQARLLAPFSWQDLPMWLGNSAETYEQWDRSSKLVLPVTLGSQTCSVILQPLSDGTMFLLSPCQELTAGGSQMAVMAQVLRQPLTELCSLAQQLSEDLEEMEDPVLQQQTASMSRMIYRLSRIACDLADLEHLQAGTYPMQIQKLDLTSMLQDLTVELTDICQAAGYRLECRLPVQQVLVMADSVLLERALLNLLSNAMKYGREDTPIRLILDCTSTTAYIQIRNTCNQAESDLLSAAFQRLSQRGVLPDPQWGIGLGLPLALNIARLMGGTVTVEADRERTVSVTLSISRKRVLQDPAVQTLPPYDYTGGMRRSLVELSDVLPDDCYDSTAI